MITAHGTVDTAVEALKLGAFDYVTKPFDRTEFRERRGEGRAHARAEPDLHDADTRRPRALPHHRAVAGR
jgi:DNA-binding NtrC family response regulator